MWTDAPPAVRGRRGVPAAVLPGGEDRPNGRREKGRVRREGGKDARDMRICVPRDGIPIRAPGIGKRTGDKRSKGKSGGLEKGSLSCW